MLGRCLPEDSHLVFDNYQDATDERVHTFLAEGLACLPAHVRTIVLSRREPSAAFARLRAERAMSLVDWETLRFTLEETGELARLQIGQTLAHETLEALHARAHGWAAGLVLVLEGNLHVGGGIAMEHDAQATFDYFAAEVVGRLDPSSQALLLRAAHLPSMTPQAAVAVSGEPRAEQLLDELVRSHCFTYRFEGNPARYQFHPLFRHFLLARAQKQLSSAQRGALLRTAASLLVDDDQPEEAAHLFTAAEDWSGLAELILDNSRALMAQGRHQLVTAWLQALPRPVLENDGWLLFNLGAARFPFDLLESRQILTRAYALFQRSDDLAGRALSWSLVVNSICYGWDDSSLLQRWIALAEEEIVPHFTALPTDSQSHFTHGMFLALMFHQPQHPQMGQWATRAEELVRACPDANQRILQGTHLVHYYLHWLGDVPHGDAILEAIRPTRVEALSPQARIAWRCTEALECWVHNRHPAGLAAVESALAVARESGVRLWDLLAMIFGAYVCYNAQDFERAETYLRDAASLVSSQRPLELAHHRYVCAWLELHRGNTRSALKNLRSVLAIADAKGGPFEQIMTNLWLAHALRADGNLGEAWKHASHALSLARTVRSSWMVYLADLCRADLAFGRGDDVEGSSCLRSAFAAAREHGYVSMFAIPHRRMAELCARAIAADIETRFATTMIRLHRLAPDTPPVRLEHWPWPLRIYTLGCFELVKDDQPVRFEGKAQRKPLDLLKALIALGGREVRQERLAEVLWPDAAGDSSQSAFTTTLSRLRKLIGEDAIAVQGGRVSLNARYCWVDLWALDAALADAERSAPGPDTAAIERVFSYYRGPFLAEESEELWTVSTRERLRSRFIRLIARGADHLARGGAHAEALALYRRGVELDELAEDFYRGLMSCHLALGEHAQAAAVYRRLKATLARVFGGRIEPAPATQALFKKLGIN
jgi:DNA-binding SARP family transcriptional activator